MERGLQLAWKRQEEEKKRKEEEERRKKEVEERLRKEMEEAERMTTTRERRAPRRGSGWEDLTIVIVWLRRTNGTDVLSLSFLPRISHKTIK